MAESVALAVTDPNRFFQNPDSDEYEVNKAMYAFIIEEYYDNHDFRDDYKRCAK